MDRKFTLIFFGLCFPSCCLFDQYYYVNLMKTWVEARQFCREKYTDLASFENMDDIDRLNRPNLVTSLTWVGLSDDPDTWKGALGNDATSWRWSETGKTSTTGFAKWLLGEPNNLLGEYCVQINTLGDWSDGECEAVLPFVCYTEIDLIKYTYNIIPKTWSDAQTYCRQFHTDLATIESSEENTKVASKVPISTTAWIGLYRDPFSWSDRNQGTFRNWMWPAPDNLAGVQHCVAENTLHQWDDVDCSLGLTFLCFGDDNLPVIEVEERKRIVVKMEIQTDVDITQPSASSQILEQLGAVLERQGWTNAMLQWKIQPKKKEPEKSKIQPQNPVTQPLCPLRV